MVNPTKIGLFGGTFDPFHKGHLAVIEAAHASLELDEVIVVPNGRNPLKGRPTASTKDRLEMVRLGIEGLPYASVSDIEIRRPGPSFMVETLSELAYVKPGRYWVIVGLDALREFHEWKNYEKIWKMARLGVARRGTQALDDVAAVVGPTVMEHVDPIDMPLCEISATDLRYRLETGRPASQWLAPSVLEYIRKEKLYSA